MGKVINYLGCTAEKLSSIPNKVGQSGYKTPLGYETAVALLFGLHVGATRIRIRLDGERLEEGVGIFFGLLHLVDIYSLESGIKDMLAVGMESSK